MKKCLLLLFSCMAVLAFAQEQPKANEPHWKGKFEQLDQMLPTPNEYRTGSGAPGPKYWQQQADYDITAELNDENQTITGSETITYSNNSPDVLKYLWVQLDQNLFEKNSNTAKTATNSMRDSSAAKMMAMQLNLWDYEGGYKIISVKDAAGKELSHTINKTMMRIDLPTPIKAGGKYVFKIDWSFHVLDRNQTFARSGYEYFPEDGNYVYTIAQWFPRMCVYDDVVGWQNKQFLGRGEFTLPFGNYKVALTVPADHVVAATGMVKNPAQVLTTTQLARFEQAKTSFDKPVIIITQQEATEKEKTKSKEKKTWQMEATNVRDFAFASSRKFIWDAMAVKIGNNTPLAQSFYPKEGNPLWEKESTRAVKNTLEVYSKHTIDYPYPQATSVHAASIGMEYPMICFNFGRPKKDGTYDNDKLKGMLGVVIHEVGHNFFPMIINNDERQTTWMDEGINSFVQLLTELERYPELDFSRGKPAGLVPYMKGDKATMRPLMTNSEQVIMFGPEQYQKAATALFILRETVMGHDLFDRSFKEYAQRWAFKHPKPADFFRTMEDASAVDLDWFWKGWFYTTDNVDQTLDQVKWYKLRTDKANVEGKEKNVAKGDLAAGKNAENFDNGPQYIAVLPTNDRMYGEFQNKIDDKAVVSKLENKNIYEVTLSNKGGLVMPVIIEWTYKDGTKETDRIPAEIWRTNENKFTKVFAKEKEVAHVTVDPDKETSDINTQDNVFPRVVQPSKFDELKKKSN
ncbi:MAG: M1 family metallopeptidase [Bacteroidetes bacterium]|nr:M1 family metallopeptidase [Bacteroidota bacterium]MBS1540071.1 M1 family metallopeptidase [Bacteroidota bacterium]